MKQVAGVPLLPWRSAHRALGAGGVLGIVVAGAITLAFASCAPPPAEPPQMETVSDLEPLPPDSPQRWVRIYDPQRAWNGYTLTLHRARRPTLIDMNGRTVHAWPGARVKSRVRLLPDGSLLGLALGRAVVEYDWRGDLTWRFSTAPDLPHHDVIRLENGNTLFPVLPDGGEADEIVEVTRAGDVVWRWSAAEHLEPFLSKSERNDGDLTHINSVEEVLENRLYRGGDERFRPGNLLVSARNLDLVFVIDRATDEVVWTYSNRLDRQHEARMVRDGFHGAGNIMLLDNGYRNRFLYRKSRIVEIEPATNATIWNYVADDFYSPTSSLAQPLPNGNVLISSSRGGRAFEVSRTGEIVWQWTPPFDPVRPQRYPYDYTPQLSSLPHPVELAVRPDPGYRHVDRWVYRFTRRSGIRKVDLAGTVRPVLVDNGMCRQILLPENGQLDVAYGIDRDRVFEAGKATFSARFSMLLTRRGSDLAIELFRDQVDTADAERWRRKTVSLGDHALEWVHLCVSTEVLSPGPPEPTEPYAFWSNPRITVAGNKFPMNDKAPVEEDHLTAEEIDAQRKHLEALGYID